VLTSFWAPDSDVGFMMFKKKNTWMLGVCLPCAVRGAVAGNEKMAPRKV
jgi:hypothetical protein